MRGAYFFLLFEEYFELFLQISIPIFLLSILYAKRTSDSWMNPVRVTVLTSSIGYCIVVFLYCLGEVRKQTFLYVLTSILLFWLIIYFFFPRDAGYLKVRLKKEFLLSRLLFRIFYFGNIFLTLFSYSRFGIPLLNEDSRLETYVDSGGYGVLLRISAFVPIYSQFYLFNRYHERRIRLGSLLLWLSPMILFGVLSGSRSSFLAFVYTYWGYNKFFLGRSIQLSKYKSLFFLFLGISLITFAIQFSINYIEASNKFFERLVASGDLYWLALPGDTWQEVSIKTPIADLFSGLLAPLRILHSYDPGIGIQLFQLISKDFNQLAGPNELFPVSSLVYFGYKGGLLFTLFQSILVCCLVKLFYKRSDSIILSSILYFSFYNSIQFMGAFRDAMGYMFNVFLNVVIAFVICSLISIVYRSPFKIVKFNRFNCK